MEQIKIREATQADSPEIVEVLKAALGEGTEKSVRNWHWKHYENPFGTSKIYVATIENEIVGVRAFMRWSWIDNSNGKILRALRAVDTAVSPKHRRKGIFLTLTNHALEKVKEEKYDFIFNTPNEKSIGGYLKLGWVLNRKIPVSLIINPLFWVHSRKKLDPISQSSLSTIRNEEHTFDSPFLSSTLICPFSKDYFEWRYVRNPLAIYGYYVYKDNVLIVYRLKKIKNLSECRIVDIQFLKHRSDKQLKKAISYLVKRFSLVSSVQGIVRNLFFGAGFTVALHLKRKGPNMVSKNISLEDSQYDNLLDKNADYWGFNLGDMELF